MSNIFEPISISKFINEICLVKSKSDLDKHMKRFIGLIYNKQIDLYLLDANDQTILHRLILSKINKEFIKEYIFEILLQDRTICLKKDRNGTYPCDIDPYYYQTFMIFGFTLTHQINIEIKNDFLLFARCPFALVFFVEKFAVILNPANRRYGIRGNLHQVQSALPRDLQGLKWRKYAELFSIFVNDANFTRANPIVDADKLFRRTLIDVPPPGTRDKARVVSITFCFRANQMPFAFARKPKYTVPRCFLILGRAP